MITGVNHLTFAVSDLDDSVGFYTGVLGFRLLIRRNGEAHLLAGDAWVVLIPDPSVRDGALPEYTHAAIHGFYGRFRRAERACEKFWSRDLAGKLYAGSLALLPGS